MDYIYDLHVHSKECSNCASSALTDMVRAYKKAGYAGFVITNHFLRGCNCVPAELDWAGKMHCYWDTYTEAKKVADELDFDLLFGIEECYGMAQEVLIYGIDLDFLLANPDMCEIPIEQLCERVREYGGFSSHAHPFRERDYIPKNYKRMDISALDGLEIYNASNGDNESNRKAEELMRQSGLKFTAGSDNHNVRTLENGNVGGLIFNRRMRTSAELCDALRSGEGRVYKKEQDR